jgi:hypothetical protein
VSSTPWRAVNEPRPVSPASSPVPEPLTISRVASAVRPSKLRVPEHERPLATLQTPGDVLEPEERSSLAVEVDHQVLEDAGALYPASEDVDHPGAGESGPLPPPS